VLDTTPALQHQLELTRLEPFSGPVEVQVRSCSSEGLCSPDAAVRIDPRGEDLRPPALLGRIEASALSGSSAVLRWRTDEPATSEAAFVEQGLGRPLQTRVDLRKSGEHRLVLTRLQPGTCYDVTVRSTDPAGNAVTFPVPAQLCTAGTRSAAPGRRTLLAGVALAAALAALGPSRAARRRLASLHGSVRHMRRSGPSSGRS
jgi:hypothetical protein